MCRGTLSDLSIKDKTIIITIKNSNMKKFFALALAVMSIASTACKKEGNKTTAPTKEMSVDATSKDTWNYISLATGEVIGTGADTEADNAKWRASKDWDMAVCRYSLRFNGGESTTAGAQGGVYTFPADVTFSSVTEVPADAIFATDKTVTSEGMSGTTVTVKSDATVILFKKNPDGSSVMPPVYLQAPVYAVRSADGTKIYKVQFTQYKDENNVSGMVMFDYASLN